MRRIIVLFGLRLCLVLSVDFTIAPEEVKAYGATLVAQEMEMEKVDDWLEQVTCSFTWNDIGVETAERFFVSMIPQHCFVNGRNFTKIFSAANDYQTSIGLKIYAGDRPLAKDNVLLEELRMYDLDLMPKEINRFNVTLFIDINDYVHVTVVDVERGRSQRQVIDGYRKMSSEEKKRLRRDARKHAEDDDTN